MKTKPPEDPPPVHAHDSWPVARLSIPSRPYLGSLRLHALYCEARLGNEICTLARTGPLSAPWPSLEGTVPS